MCCQPGNRHGLPASQTDRRPHSSTRTQLRWNHARSAERANPLRPGLEGKEMSSPSSRGRKMSLTSALIDQAIAQLCVFSSPKLVPISAIGIFRQLRTRPQRIARLCGAVETAQVHRTVRQYMKEVEEQNQKKAAPRGAAFTDAHRTTEQSRKSSWPNSRAGCEYCRIGRGC